MVITLQYGQEMDMGKTHLDLRWQLLPWFKFRQAGFPIEWLLELASAETTENANALFQLQKNFATGRRLALDTLRDLKRQHKQSDNAVEVQQTLLEIHTCIREEEVVPLELTEKLITLGLSSVALETVVAWNSLLQTLKEQILLFRDTYSQERTRAAKEMLGKFRAERWLREALLLSNESHFDVFNGWIDPASENDVIQGKDLSKLDLLSLYYQRFCAKNETIAHFGPFAAGQMFPEREEALVLGEEETRLRRTFYTHWASTRLAEEINRDQKLYWHIRPRWNSFVLLEYDQLYNLDYTYDHSLENEIERGMRLRHLGTLKREEIQLLWACNSENTLNTLYQQWQDSRPDASRETFQAMIGKLKELGAIVVEFEIPAGSFDALEDLRAMLPEDDEAAQPWLNSIDSIHKELQRFAHGESTPARREIFKELKAQFAQLTDTNPERGLGQPTADRSILFEECQRKLQTLFMGGPLTNAIASELACFYDLLLLAPKYRLKAEREMLNKWFIRQFGEDQQVPLATFLSCYIKDSVQLEKDYQVIDADGIKILQSIESQLMPAELREKSIVELDLEDVEKILNSYDLPIRAYCNPDIMLLAPSQEALRSGNFQIMVGDCHATRDLLAHASSGPFMAETFPEMGEGIVKQYQTIVAEDEVVVDIVRSHLAKTSVQVTLPCPDLEVDGRSPKPASQVFHLNDLYVCQTEQGLRLSSPRIPQYLRLMTPAFLDMQVKRNPFSIFGFPLHRRGLPVRGIGMPHLPRLVINRVIVQRESWRIPAGAFHETVLDKHVQLNEREGKSFLLAKKVQQTYNLSRFCFASIPGEPKPIYVDFDAPLTVRQLTRLARKVNKQIEFGEMLPSPKDLWLSDSKGHYTSEARCSLFQYTSEERSI
jgi:hypothetical protein